MVNQITQALSRGFTTKQIVDFLIKQFPQHSNKIKSALTAGFSIDQIVKFLSGGKQALNREEVQGGTEHEITRKRDIQQRENVNKGFGTAAALGASALAAPMAASALSRAIPSSLQTILPNILQQQGFQNTPIPQTQPALVPTNPQQHPINQQIPNNIPQPTIPQQPQINIPQILNNYQGFTKKIDDLLKSGNDIEKISAYFRNFTASQAKKLEKETGLPLEEIVKEYIASKPAETIAEKMEMKPQEISPPLPETKDEEVAPEAPKIEKKSVVATPSGIGTVLEVRNGKALIDIDGQKKQVDEDDLIQSPLPERDLADLHDDLIKGIEHETGEDVSRMVNFSGYDPNTNSLAFLPYDGALYIYDDLTDEEKATAMNLMAKRKTSGENHIGAWTKDTKSPAGAAMSAFIKKLQESRGGKGNEYQRKYATVYSAFEPAIKASKEKKKKKKKKP